MNIIWDGIMWSGGGFLLLWALREWLMKCQERHYRHRYAVELLRAGYGVRENQETGEPELVCLPREPMPCCDINKAYSKLCTLPLGHGGKHIHMDESGIPRFVWGTFDESGMDKSQ